MSPNTSNQALIRQHKAAANGIVQRVEEDEEEAQVQLKREVPTPAKVASGAPVAPAANKTGLPGPLKAGVESLSGVSLDGVKVHYNSPKPAQLQALAYTQGSEIHVGPGQEKHLPHEVWHVVQQAQGRVRPTMQMKDGVAVNDDAGLEREADVMGARAVQSPTAASSPTSSSPRGGTMIQRMKKRGAGTALVGGAPPKRANVAAPAPAVAPPVVAPPAFQVHVVMFQNGHALTPYGGNPRFHPMWLAGVANHAAAYSVGAAPRVVVSVVPAGGYAGAPIPTWIQAVSGGVILGQAAGTLIAGNSWFVVDLLPLAAVGVSNFNLTWQVWLNGAWQNVGVSGAHRMYTTLGAPLMNPVPNFALDKATWYAGGANNAAAAAPMLRHGLRAIEGLAYNPADPINADPLTVFADGVGICTDFANLLAYLARALGIPATTLMYWGGFSSMGRNVKVTLAGQYASLLHVASLNPAYNPAPVVGAAPGWAFTYHAIANIAGAYHDAALDIAGFSGQAVHQGLGVQFVEPLPQVNIGQVNQPAFRFLPRVQHNVAVTHRNYGAQITGANFADYYRLSLPPVPPNPWAVPVLWTAMTPMPAGLVLSPLGLVYGTPTHAGSTQVLVQIDGGGGLVNYRTITMHVAP